jgi:putative Mg2+ transporter-C (MgtC) family protein
VQYVHFLVDILAAMLFGAIIGFERQRFQHMAVLRTNALVALGAAAFVAISATIAGGENALDHTRIAAQVVCGIGFLGGGLIVKDGLNVRGLNTAATIWCAGAVGSLAGLGELVPAAITTIAVLITNVALRPLSYRVHSPSASSAVAIETHYAVEIECRPPTEPQIRNSLLLESADKTLLFKSLRRETDDDQTNIRIAVEIVTQGRNDRLIERVASRLSLENGIRAVTWRLHGEAAV